MDYDNPWTYQGKPFNSEDIGDYFGFVYEIVNLKTGRRYIGKKFFIHTKRVAVKGKKRKKVTKFESDWKGYFGSCKPLLADVENLGKDQFSREILGCYLTKGKVNYNETKMQFIRDVLEAVDIDGNRLYYNDNILSRYFSPRK